ncbi:hypothetical protein KIW84_041961 [Lathyrus oleraceus]|uniref:Uncharacterized protein n=1 Tax=Pisum sativum TaxID=3888 RepID=A0A9D4XBB8_PEA|nr:hypothetical protein KIW84_041961 [Pisum sativum]
MAVYSVLDDASALASLPGDVDGYISICGYGSLLSEKSARSTFPNLINFRTARLTGFRRLFSFVGAFFFTHGIANLKTQEIAALSVEPYEDETFITTVFDIKKTEVVKTQDIRF